VKKPYSPHLDVRNVMWLLAAMTVVVLPHLMRLPSWIAIFFTVVLGWRAWIAWYALRTPPRLVMWSVTIAAFVGTFLTHGSVIGREGAVTLLIVMAALKLLEMRNERDVVLSVYLGFFLVITNFLFSQTIPMGIYMLACVWIFVATLVGFNHAGKSPSVPERARPAAALVLQALPLMAAFFLLFPRVQGPLWALPQDSRAGLSGLSDSMKPGTIANLIKSDAVVFRVQFEDQIPPYQALYWRGPVLVHFDGGTWRRNEFDPFIEPRYERREAPTNYTVTLEGSSSKNWLFALDVPGSLPPAARLRSDLQMLSLRPLSERFRYDMVSYLDFRYGTQPSGISIRTALKFDPARNPRTVALGKQWAAEERDPQAVLARAVTLFNREFKYTLEPPTLDTDNPYDDFLFNVKEGFCEHYAGAFTLLARSAGIPARVVTGYQGGEFNPMNNELIVRQADAHAWVEVWLQERGWTRIDPTGVVSPLRVSNGVNAALGPIGVIPSLIAADHFKLLSTLRFAWHAMNSRWDQWVVNYNLDRQRDFFSQLGIGSFDWRMLGLWMMLATFVIGGLVSIGLLVRDRPPRREAAVLAWSRFCGKLATAGLERAPHEGPMDFLARVRATRPALAADVEEIVELYVDARYGAGVTREGQRKLAKLVREFRPG
jgi:protein-glutamine gamma-glutamyltransferase